MASIFSQANHFPLPLSLPIIPSTSSRCRRLECIQHFFTHLAFGKLATARRSNGTRV